MIDISEGRDFPGYSEPAPSSSIEPIQTHWPDLQWNEVIKKKPGKKAGKRKGKQGHVSKAPATTSDAFDTSILSANFSQLPEKLGLAQTGEVASQAVLAAATLATTRRCGS